MTSDLMRLINCGTITTAKSATEQKLSNLAAAIAAGTFKIDAHKIARKIITRSLLN